MWHIDMTTGTSVVTHTGNHNRRGNRRNRGPHQPDG
jgi:hypothetical protein